MRGHGGVLHIDDTTFDSGARSRLVANLRKADGLCRGSLTLNFVGENQEEKVYLRIRIRVKDGCFLEQDWLFLNIPADISYRTTQKTKRVITGYTNRGYPIWRYVRTGERKSERFKAQVAVLVVDGSITVLSDRFGVYNIALDRYSYKQFN